MSWIDLFKKYGTTLTTTVDNVYSEFPLSELKSLEAISDEDLNLMFEEFINSKIKQIDKEGGSFPTDLSGLTHYGFYFKDQEIICDYGLISEFNKWLSNTKGLKQRPVSRLISDLGFKKTNVRINEQLITVFKLNSVLPF
jgi:hypothetical protein